MWLGRGRRQSTSLSPPSQWQAGQYHCVLTSITNDTLSATLTTIQCNVSTYHHGNSVTECYNGGEAKVKEDLVLLWGVLPT